MFCSVKASACFDTSAPAPGTDDIDLVAASKNIPKAFSAWSIVFSARSRSSAGTSSFGSIMVALLPFLLIITLVVAPASGPAAATAAGRGLSWPERWTKCNAGARSDSRQRVFGKGFVGGEVFDELDHLKALPGRELEKGTQQAQTFDRAGRRRTELEVQFGGEIEVFHLAPITAICLVDG